MLATVNHCHARRSLVALDRLRELVRSPWVGARDALLRRIEALQHADDAFVSAVCARRVFVEVQKIHTLCSYDDAMTGAARDEGVPRESASAAAWLLVLDPRMLLTEFVICSPLRARQVTLLRGIASSVDRGDSGIFQMQMGAGKTTVLSPLLALALGTQQTLVLSVVPPPLLPMTMAAFRRVLQSPVIHKPVITFSFDRTMGVCASVVPPVPSTGPPLPPARSSRKRRAAVGAKSLSPPPADGVVRVALPWCWVRDYAERMNYMFAENLPDDVQPPKSSGAWCPLPPPSAFLHSGLAELTATFLRLKRAAEEGWVVCTTPEAIKSVFLRYVDLLHAEKESAKQAASELAALSQASTDSSPPPPPESVPLASMQRARVYGLAADIHADILRLFRASGAEGSRSIALLDEADLQLDPLRSELNFPVGEKQVLPLSPARWLLPMFLVDAILGAHAEVCSSSSTPSSAASLSDSPWEGQVLPGVTRLAIAAALSSGLQLRHVQVRVPRAKSRGRRLTAHARVDRPPRTSSSCRRPGMRVDWHLSSRTSRCDGLCIRVANPWALTFSPSTKRSHHSRARWRSPQARKTKHTVDRAALLPSAYAWLRHLLEFMRRLTEERMICARLLWLCSVRQPNRRAARVGLNGGVCSRCEPVPIEMRAHAYYLAATRHPRHPYALSRFACLEWPAWCCLRYRTACKK